MKFVGVDVFIVQKEIPQVPSTQGRLELKGISNRGSKVWPGPAPTIELIDVFCCRFLATSDKEDLKSSEISDLLKSLEKMNFEWVHVEKLLWINGKAGFSRMDGEL